MTNLLTTLSKELQSKLSDYKVSNVFIEHGEVNIFSEYDLDYSFVEAVERELQEQGIL